MNKSRLEAFSDGVIAIMVLEIKVPHGEQLADLLPLWPVFLSYLLSFTNVGIYWTNHHHFALDLWQCGSGYMPHQVLEGKQARLVISSLLGAPGVFELSEILARIRLISGIRGTETNIHLAT